MDEILRKGMRIKKPRQVNVQLRSEVYDWLVAVCFDHKCSVPVYVRGIVEDFYDKHMDAAHIEEVSE